MHQRDDPLQGSLAYRPLPQPSAGQTGHRGVYFRIQEDNLLLLAFFL